MNLEPIKDFICGGEKKRKLISQEPFWPQMPPGGSLWLLLVYVTSQLLLLPSRLLSLPFTVVGP